MLDSRRPRAGRRPEACGPLPARRGGARPGHVDEVTSVGCVCLREQGRDSLGWSISLCARRTYTSSSLAAIPGQAAVVTPPVEVKGPTPPRSSHVAKVSLFRPHREV